MNPAELIVRNSIRCTQCEQEIVSFDRHDFKYCKCGVVAVDGGPDYLRRLGNSWVDTSIVAIRERDDAMGVLETAHLLERTGQGWHVSAISHADAPLLDAWRVLEVARLPVPRVLVGVVRGHPDFADSTLIATTGLVRIEADEGWARTTRRFYRLGGRQQ